MPVRGDRSRVSCHNHLSNLEMLCPPCHVEVGLEQDYADGTRQIKLPPTF